MIGGGTVGGVVMVVVVVVMVAVVMVVVVVMAVVVNRYGCWSGVIRDLPCRELLHLTRGEGFWRLHGTG